MRLILLTILDKDLRSTTVQVLLLIYSSNNFRKKAHLINRQENLLNEKEIRSQFRLQLDKE